MNKTILGLVGLLVIFLVGCQAAQTPAMPAEPGAPSGTPSAVPSGEPSGVSPAPAESAPVSVNAGMDIEQACHGLLGEGEFEAVCGYDGRVVLTAKISEGGCWLNIADHVNNKLTAGFTVVDWKKADEANDEFDRGVRARQRQGAVEAKEVGERDYHYQEIGRENIVWVKGTYLTKLGSMHELCPADKLVEVAKKVNSRLP